MLRYMVVRLSQGMVVLFLVSLTVFTILQLAPGDPVDLIVGEAQMTAEQREEIRRFWGLDRPPYIQYFSWLGNILQGDFGRSVNMGGLPVSRLLATAAPATLKLNALAFFFSVLVAIPAGIISAVRRYSVFDHASMLLSTFGIALPGFWVGLMLIVLFSQRLGWLPPYGMQSWKSYVLPVAVLATEQTALIARVMRSTTLEVMAQDYVTTARAKGLAERIVLLRHVVRNALLPVVTVLGYRLSFLLSGTVVIETIFAWPGIGRLLINAIFRRDYQVVQTIVLLSAALIILINLLTDLIYAYVDPRIRYR
ncbi:MAG: ABC transporter permease [Chloroflexota bacterium]|nr:ABC transporter permease [Chloroflexota bacterium]